MVNDILILPLKAVDNIFTNFLTYLKYKKPDNRSVWMERSPVNFLRLLLNQGDLDKKFVTFK